MIDAADPPAGLPAADLVIDAAYGTGFRGEYRPPRAAAGHAGARGRHPLGRRRPHRAGRRAGRSPPTAPSPSPRSSPACSSPTGPSSPARSRWPTSASTRRAATHPRRRGRRRRPAGSRAGHARATSGRPRVWVVAGSPGMTGAAHLTTRAAQRAGAGYVRLSTPGRRRRSRPADRGRRRRRCPAEGWADDGARRARAVPGPGGRARASAPDPMTAAEVRSAGPRRAACRSWSTATRLTALGTHRGRRASPAARHPTVLTPHDGELARLGGDADDPDRIGVTRALAADIGAVVLRKGSTTIVAAPDGATLLVDHRRRPARHRRHRRRAHRRCSAALLAQGVPAAGGGRGRPPTSTVGPAP